MSCTASFSLWYEPRFAEKTNAIDGCESTDVTSRLKRCAKPGIDFTGPVVKAFWRHGTRWPQHGSCFSVEVDSAYPLREPARWDTRRNFKV